MRLKLERDYKMTHRSRRVAMTHEKIASGIRENVKPIAYCGGNFGCDICIIAHTPDSDSD